MLRLLAYKGFLGTEGDVCPVYAGITPFALGCHHVLLSPPRIAGFTLPEAKEKAETSCSPRECWDYSINLDAIFQSYAFAP